MNPRHTGKVARLPENTRNQPNESTFSAKIPKPIINRSKAHQPPITNRYENRPFSPVTAYYRLFAVFREFCHNRSPHSYS
jgi:hypothetical protein